MYDLARRLATGMGETYDALDREKREWWNELAERVVGPMLDDEYAAGKDAIRGMTGGVVA